MQFAKKLRPLVKSGEVTTSIRIWQKPRVKVGNRYRLDEGFIEVEKLMEIEFDAITPAMSRASGFAGTADLLKTAKHGTGERIFFVEFHYVTD